ncbi:MAG: hypothetical protein INH41_23940 [Myxococcaceae bacterium]|jgi:hypothetical protein|nr:hypothetical protein [Myxococcaceae bacterium]
MGRLISLVVGLAAISAVVYWTLLRPSTVTPSGKAAAPTQVLEETRGAARRIEAEAQERADDTARKAFENE